MVKHQHIEQIKEYKSVADPLRNLQKEIKEANDRLDQIGTELSRYAVKSDSPGAWNTYLNEGQDGAEQRDALKAEATKLADRKRLLEKALNEGRQEVDRVCGQLSREPCKQARPRNVEQVNIILAAQQQIRDACVELRKIREELEDAGYKTGSLAPGEFSMTGFETYQRYVRDNYPEVR